MSEQRAPYQFTFHSSFRSKDQIGKGVLHSTVHNITNGILWNLLILLKMGIIKYKLVGLVYKNLNKMYLRVYGDKWKKSISGLMYPRLHRESIWPKNCNCLSPFSERSHTSDFKKICSPVFALMLCHRQTDRQTDKHHFYITRFFFTLYRMPNG
jgi:hypothetical protein